MCKVSVLVICLLKGAVCIYAAKWKSESGFGEDLYAAKDI